ncbi:hypothetical protein GCM10010439_50020 [Actinocorallia aurantiaca]|uniref:Uncharacterized protein n=1 Tax=Actinocorallia aurantiaca TaxID=46204 RepID=A0ABP6GX72_9ACTN
MLLPTPEGPDRTVSRRAEDWEVAEAADSVVSIAVQVYHGGPSGRVRTYPLTPPDGTVAGGLAD